METKKILISRDVVFHENIFPYGLKNHIPTSLFPNDENAPTIDDHDSSVPEP